MKKQFSLTRAAFSTCGGAKANFLSVTACATRLLPLLLLLTLPAVVRAQSYTNSYGVWYYTTNNGTITITQYTGPGGDVTIPDRINGLPVTTIGGYYDYSGWLNGAFADCTSLTNITIPNSVTSIEDRAFYGCASLTNITIPNSVTNIGAGAFTGCTGLSSITIPNSVASIEDRAFYGCASLTSFTIPNGVTQIGEFAFCYCSSLSNITFGNSVTNIGCDAFWGCAGLTSITIPDSVTQIEGLAFAWCASLSNACFQGNAPSVGSLVFYGDCHAIAYYLPGTTGWGSTFAGLPAVLWNSQGQTQSPPEALVLTGANNGTIVEAVIQQPITINLDENPSTGSEWFLIGVSGASVVSNGPSFYISYPLPMPGLRGGGGIVCFSYLAVASGPTTLSYAWYPCYPQCEPSYSVTIDVAPMPPVLSLTLIGGNVLLTWPITNSSGFFLEGTASLQPAQWAALNVSPQSDGQNYWLTLAPSGSAIYFRLHKP